jgi:hypothetical protein
MSELHPLQVMAMEEIELRDQFDPRTGFEFNNYYEGVVAARSLVSSRCEIHLRKMLFNLRLAITEGPLSPFYRDVYCYHDETLAWIAFHTWDGTGDPFGFFKHANTGRYARPAEAR